MWPLVHSVVQAVCAPHCDSFESSQCYQRPSFISESKACWSCPGAFTDACLSPYVQGFLSSLELVPMFNGVDHDVEVGEGVGCGSISLYLHGQRCIPAKAAPVYQMLHGTGTFVLSTELGAASTPAQSQHFLAR
jgi:hypothetical protein